MVLKPTQDQLKFRVRFAILHSPFSLQLSSSLFTCNVTLISHQPTMTFFPPQREVILPSVTSSPFLPTNLKSWNMLQRTWLGVIRSKDLASLSQAVSGIQRSILDLFSSLLLKNSILCLCPSSSTPLGQQDASLHDITHWPRLWHTFLFHTPYFILFFFLSFSCLYFPFPGPRQSTLQHSYLQIFFSIPDFPLSTQVFWWILCCLKNQLCWT